MARKLHTPAHVLGCLRELFRRSGGIPPTIKELRDCLDVGSTRTVLRYLQELEELGWITRWPGARGIRINAPDDWVPEDDGWVPLNIMVMVSGELDLSDEENRRAVQDVAQAAVEKAGW